MYKQIKESYLNNILLTDAGGIWYSWLGNIVLKRKKYLNIKKILVLAKVLFLDNLSINLSKLFSTNTLYNIEFACYMQKLTFIYRNF